MLSFKIFFNGIFQILKDERFFEVRYMLDRAFGSCSVFCRDAVIKNIFKYEINNSY